MTAAPRFAHLFVIAYGRSGSTLLTGYLNRLPGLCVRGENNGAVLDLWRFARRLEGARAMAGAKPADAPTHPWFGIDGLDLAGVRRDVAELVIRRLVRPPDGARTVGFKEIRHDPSSVEDLDDYLAFLVETFPATGLILHQRAVAATARSKWWADDPDADRTIAAIRARFLGSRFADDPRVLHTDYDRFVEGPAEAARVARFLGLAPDEAAWRETLAIPHSY